MPRKFFYRFFQKNSCNLSRRVYNKSNRKICDEESSRPNGDREPGAVEAWHLNVDEPDF